MYILSKIHDYYDSAVGEGIDKTIIYQRNPVTIKETPEYGIKTGWSGLRIYGSGMGRYPESDWEEWFTVGFCGKVYLGLMVHRQNSYSFYYGEDCLIPFQNIKDTWRNGNLKDTKEYIRQLHGKEFPDFFFKYETPIFYYGPTDGEVKNVCTINDRLKDVQFYKVKDSYTAFQEIQSFISGVLGTNRDPVSVPTDKEKILSHGFDTKWSFRNPLPPLRKQK
jgi:hypothetical protein